MADRHGHRCSYAAKLAILTCALLLVAGVMDAVTAQSLSFGSRQPATASSSASFFGWIFSQQAAFYRSLSALVRASKTDGAAIWALLGFSFLYGVFHAAGPGHGKAVISSYLVANNETWKRGVTLSFASAMLQAIVAIAIVAIGAVVLEVTAKAMGDAVRVIEIVSYGLVVLIGVRLLWVKGRSFLRSCRDIRRARSLGAAAATERRAPDFSEAEAGCGCHHHGQHHGQPRDHFRHEHSARKDGDPACDHDHASACGHAHGPEPEGLAGAGGWRRGFAAVLAVGARPCSGAIIILVFALSQDMFWTGMGSALMMGAGTAITIAAIATLAVCARDLAGRMTAARPGRGVLVMKGIEIGAAAMIIAVGLFLLTGFMASEQLWTFSA
ncbi:nickel/cobalt transporter [Nitrobacter sp. TKz-YC01]|uniref:nickel/cobalt transporter n=1 Tax=Nitrobacter sp. TKz-YC01 TaxID=3398703 RepID=UPI003A0FDA2C